MKIVYNGTQRRYLMQQRKQELSSLGSQLECWKNGMLEKWVLEKWDRGLLLRYLLVGKLKMSKFL